jgi:hypothetical protein
MALEQGQNIGTGGAAGTVVAEAVSSGKNCKWPICSEPLPCLPRRRCNPTQETLPEIPSRHQG